MKYYITLALLASCTTAAHGQAQLRFKPEMTVSANGEAQPASALVGASSFLVQAPKPKDFAIHDLVTIVINESSKSSSQQKLDSKTDAKVKATLSRFPDLGKLIEGELANSESNPITAADVGGGDSFKGDAKYERNDRVSDRVTAVVVDMKPNGTLVLEARRTIAKDDEVQTVVLSGMVRREDVTNANSVLSSQIADLTVRIENEGELKDANQPGWITRLMRTVFDF
jgi:flagellar L-ring protein precursor FlgH